MKTREKGICGYCHFKRICSLTESNAAVWHCSEYKQETTLTTPKSFTHSTETVAKTGLCSSCLTNDSCSLQEQDAVIFHCEHYQ